MQYMYELVFTSLLRSIDEIQGHFTSRRHEFLSLVLHGLSTKVKSVQTNPIDNIEENLFRLPNFLLIS